MSNYPVQARVLTCSYVNARSPKLPAGEEITLGSIHIVWFTKTLQNWKCLLICDHTPGMFYEVTFNGDKDEAYIDAYKKTENVVVTIPPETSIIDALLTGAGEIFNVVPAVQETVSSN